MFRWDEAQLYGVPLSLMGIDRRLDWDRPARDLNEWLESVGLWLMEDVENGFVHRARRRLADGYVELRGPGWPGDLRFWVDAVGPGHHDAWLRVPFVQRDGLDPAPAIERRDAKKLVAWVTAYENNSSGSPYLGQATVIHTRPGVAEIDQVEFAAGVPDTLVLDVVRTATHAAAAAGAATVITHLSLSHLSVAGFRPQGDHQAVATTFFDEDHDAAQALLVDELKNPGRWGRDRDEAGRYLPTARVGRLSHRLRHGPSGTKKRTYAS
jgi:ribosomal protein L35AE/L33A